ncbi:transglutaminase-like cysteine peptidase [Microvirga sp. BT688]|uniref:transglutaminase-like cysteine peptidase n=1 Tax=Microvirga sp. TaxID=1873136 RepID=UPI0016828E09|nr:transglutaminase-like cysteine peptidase [Microvirga sp.]MBD2750346.1 transglutaminase-like cysteine peptidase [Microvirga sp.]
MANAGLIAGLVYLILVLVLFSVLPTSSSRGTTSVLTSPHLPTKQGAGPIAAWRKLCELHPTECQVNPMESETIQLTPRIWLLLASVNQWVNATIKPRADVDRWGMEDHWDFPRDGYGDCEDYQLLKRKLLVRAGLPARALRMTVVLDEAATGHAVMLVRTDRGDFILDNKRSDILPWHETGYIYIKRESDEGVDWVWLGAAASLHKVASSR